MESREQFTGVNSIKFYNRFQSERSSGLYPLEGEVHVDEFYVGGEEEQKRGRSKGKKKLVVVALEVIPGKQIPHTDITAMKKHTSCSISTTQSIQFFGRSYLQNRIFNMCIKYDPTANGSQRETHT